MRPEVTEAVQTAAETRLYAHARMALALALVARELPPDSRHALSLAHAARMEATHARAGTSPSALTNTLATQADATVEHIVGERPPDWRAAVEEALGATVRELWGVEVLL